MKVRFDGCVDSQVRWGGGSDPREYFTIGEVYEVDDIETHSWHTLYYLAGFDKSFNAVCFTEIKE